MIWHWQFTLRSWIGPFTIYFEPLIVKRIFLGAAPVTPGTCELSRGDLKFKISTSFNQKIELPAFVVVSIKLNFSSLPYSCHTVNKYINTPPPSPPNFRRRPTHFEAISPSSLPSAKMTSKVLWTNIRQEFIFGILRYFLLNLWQWNLVLV